MNYIIGNIKRICFPKKEEYLDDKWLVRDYFEEQKVMKKFIIIFVKHLHLFNHHFKL